MERVCFTMRVAREHLDRYVAMHAEPWPELLDGLRRTGWRNYSLFLRDDGALIGYLEAHDWRRASEAMDALPVSPRWSTEMDRLVVPGTTMRFHDLLSERGEHDPAARRVAAMLDGPPPPLPPWRSAALFRTDAGAVLYGETADAGATGLGVQEFREVFNLDELVARILN